MPVEPDVEFKHQLERRISAYEDQEASLRARLRLLQDELEALQRRRRSAEHLFQVEFGSSIKTSPNGANGQRGPGPLTGLPWGDAMVRVLQGEGSGLHVKEIWRRMSEGGFRSDAADPIRSVVAVAMRHGGIVRVGPNTYALDGQLPLGGIPGGVPGGVGAD